VFVSLQNPIEPSINDLDSLNEALDSRINTYNPIYQHVEMSNHDVNSVPRTHSYQPKNPLYDSEYVTTQDIPSLFPEDSYDYKYLGLPLNKYLAQPSTTESSIPINLVAIRKTSVFGYGFPSYKSPYSSDSVWNLDSKIPNNIFGDSQSVETDSETFKVSSPIVRIVQLLPETLQQDPIPESTLYPNYSLLLKLLSGNPNEIKKSAKDESTYEITQETPTEDESDSTTSEETQTENQTNILVLEENLTEDESNSITTEETQTEDNSNTLVNEENPTKNIFNFITIEENLTGDESNSITTEKTPAENKLNSQVFVSVTTEAESNSIKTEDESNSNTIKETQAKDNELMSTTSQKTTTDFKQKDAFGKHWYLNSDETMKELFKEYEKFITNHNMKPQLLTSVDNIPAKSQTNLLSGEDTNQEFQPQLANGVDTYDEYET